MKDLLVKYHKSVAYTVDTKEFWECYTGRNTTNADKKRQEWDFMKEGCWTSKILFSKHKLINLLSWKYVLSLLDSKHFSWKVHPEKTLCGFLVQVTDLQKWFIRVNRVLDLWYCYTGIYTLGSPIFISHSFTNRGACTIFLAKYKS